MSNSFKNFFPRSVIGIDIGTFSIKIVELSRWGGVTKLKNYGEAKSSAILGQAVAGNTAGSVLSPDIAAMAVKEILQEAKIKTKTAIFSIPDFSTFCTSFDLPPMTKKEIGGAIRYNASQYITLPISEVTLDWKITSNTPLDGKSPLKVFIVAMPNQVVNDFRAIARGAGLELCALEAEAFSLAKSLVKDDKKTICLVDIGVQSSTLNIIDRGFLKRSYSFPFASGKFSGVKSMGPDLYSSLEPLLEEIKNISAEFMQTEEVKVGEIYLAGGIVGLPGLKEYFAKVIQKQVLTPNCFDGISYPKVIEGEILKMSSRFSVAAGAALDALEI